MNISKSQYIRGLQCHKSLWLYKNKPELRDAPDYSQESLFNTGHSVGELAKDLFPNGVEVEFDADNFNGMIAKTKELIANGTEVIYEATFSEDDIFAMADILVKNGDAWDMYEVKASTKVKEYHIDDASIQWYVLSKAIRLNRAYIVHINNQYEREGKLDIRELFTIADITEQVQDKQYTIAPNLADMEQALKGEMPNIDIGGHCGDPFGCDFKEHCWKDIPTPSVFNLYWMNGSKKFEMYYKGMMTYADIPDDYRLNDTQKLQIETAKTGEPYIDKNIIKDFLSTIKYPINFFDFETFQNAIPRFDNQRPYQQMPFQYSLHILHEDGSMEHKEFLGDENSDTREELIKQMLDDITPTGSIVAYNQSFEMSRIKELATFKESREEELLALNERFIDLIVPFRGRGYYHPDFNGSFSIKSVLPAMFPNDDELDYKKLGSIQNGGDAMDTFANLYLLKDKSKRDEIRQDLLAYCHLDTLAMVKIWGKLYSIVDGKDELQDRMDISPVQVRGDSSIQGSVAWLKWRKDFRSASQASTVLGVNPFETAEEMKRREMGIEKEIQSNFAMRRGIDREDEVRKKAQEYFGRVFEPQCWEYGKYAASLDGIDDKGEVLVELKVSNYTYYKLKKGYIPENYKVQVMQQLMCSGAKQGYVVAMNVDTGEIEVSNMIELEVDFYDKLEAGWLAYENLPVPKISPAI